MREKEQLRRPCSAGKLREESRFKEPVVDRDGKYVMNPQPEGFQIASA
jgi:hypothetical protein